jgi:hypothetical protein
VANLAASSPTTHHPFFGQTSQLAASAGSSFGAEWVHKVEPYLQLLHPGPGRRLGDDQLGPLPPAVAVQHAQFLVGKAPFAPSDLST